LLVAEYKCWFKKKKKKNMCHVNLWELHRNRRGDIVVLLSLPKSFRTRCGCWRRTNSPPPMVLQPFILSWIQETGFGLDTLSTFPQILTPNPIRRLCDRPKLLCLHGSIYTRERKRTTEQLKKTQATIILIHTFFSSGKIIQDGLLSCITATLR